MEGWGDRMQGDPCSCTWCIGMIKEQAVSSDASAFTLVSAGYNLVSELPWAISIDTFVAVAPYGVLQSTLEQMGN